MGKEKGCHRLQDKHSEGWRWRTEPVLGHPGLCGLGFGTLSTRQLDYDLEPQGPLSRVGRQSRLLTLAFLYLPGGCVGATDMLH